MATYTRAITDLGIWLGRKVLKPTGGMGEITGATECEGEGGIGANHRTVEGIRIDDKWYSVSSVVRVNPALILPDDEEWIS